MHRASFFLVSVTPLWRCLNSHLFQEAHNDDWFEGADLIHVIYTSMNAARWCTAVIGLHPIRQQ